MMARTEPPAKVTVELFAAAHHWGIVILEKQAPN
jgi:hypothetical protein